MRRYLSSLCIRLAQWLDPLLGSERLPAPDLTGYQRDAERIRSYFDNIGVM